MTIIPAHAPARLPLTVNYHFIKNCNFACQYCFATFDSVTGRHRYSAPILAVGHDKAFAEVTFDHDKFATRGGAHDYCASDTPAPAMARKLARVASPTRAGEPADTPSRRTTH